MKCKLKYGDIVLYKDCVGVVRNAAVNQVSVSVAWAHNPRDLGYYVPVHTANTFEVLPQDVGAGLVQLYCNGVTV